MATSSLEAEIAFFSGVAQDGTVADVAYQTWRTSPGYPALPPPYGSTSEAVKWGPKEAGTGAEVSYYFSPGWDGDEITALKAGLALWSAVANITFRESTEPATANFWINKTTSGGANQDFGPYTNPLVGSAELGTPPPNNSSGNQRIAINTSDDSFGPIGTNLDEKGGYPLYTVVHEIGHMLGLGHGGTYDGNVDAMTQQFSNYDTRLWTVMSYIGPSDPAKFFSDYTVTGTNWGSNEDGWAYAPLTPMMLDILAIQRLYGAPTSGPLAGGGHTFGYGSNIGGEIGKFYDFDINKNPVITIWDGGSGNTLDLSGFGGGATISLIPGTFSSTHGKTNNIGIAYFTRIETAIGGNGDDRIIASDLDSKLFGGGGSDMLYGGAGNDILAGGAAPDTVDPGGGLNILRDSLASMHGDTVFNFGQSTTVDVTGALIGRDNLLVTHENGWTTLTMGPTSILLAGAFSDGDFMSVARGTGSGAHTQVTFETYLPALFEGVRVAPDAINGIANQPFLTGDGTVRFTMKLEAAISTFGNSLGIYKVAGDGMIFDTHIVFSNTHGVSAAMVDLGAPSDAVRIGFFLIQNGFGAYGSLPDNLSFVTPGTGGPANLNAGVPVTLVSDTLGALTATQIFHSFATLNASDANQVLSGVAPGGRDLLIGFEDLPTATGDNDFQDVVIRIQTNHDDIFIA